MCVSKGAPKKPSYGPCNETHGLTGTTINYSGGFMDSNTTNHTTISFVPYNYTTSNTNDIIIR